MNLLTSGEIAAQGYTITYPSMWSENAPDPFDYGHYLRYEHGNGATENGVALLARGVEPEDEASLAALVRFGTWNRLGRYSSSFEVADTELRAAFSSLKEATSKLSGRAFHVPDASSQVEVSASEGMTGFVLGLSQRYTTIQRRGVGILADRTIVGAGLTLGEGLMVPIHKERSARIQAVAANVAQVLNEVLATRVAGPLQ